MISSEAVMEALRTVFDPELGINVVDLGLIYGVEIEGDKVSVKMTLTTRGCPLHDSIARGVRSAVKALPGVGDATVDLVWEPAWTPERMTESARKELGH